MPEEKPKKRIWDKLLMGAIIGGAIGSVVGASIAPKKGKETRKEIAEAVKNTKKGSRIFFQRFKAMFLFWKHGEKTHKQKTKENQPAHQPHSSKYDHLKKIPHEDTVKTQQRS